MKSVSQLHQAFLLVLTVFQLITLPMFTAVTCRVLETMRVMGDEICYRAKECKYLEL